jgi:hypothetical protein
VVCGTRGPAAAAYDGLITIYDDGQVASVDPQTGVATLLGQTSTHPWSCIHATAYDWRRNKVYLDWCDAVNVYTINAANWQVENVAHMRYAYPYGFAYDSARDRLLVSSESEKFLLWQMDPSTGSMVTIVADLITAVGSNQGMTYVPSEDTVYLFRQCADQDSLVKFGLTTGQLTTIKSGSYWNNTGFGEICSMAYNPQDGYLYAVDGFSHNLGRIDPATGTVMQIGPAGALAGSRTILYLPEPATLSLLVLGGLALVRRRARG